MRCVSSRHLTTHPTDLVVDLEDEESKILRFSNVQVQSL